MYCKRYLFVSTQDTTQEEVAEKMRPAPPCNRELKKTIQRKKGVKKRKKIEKKTGEKNLSIEELYDCIDQIGEK